MRKSWRHCDKPGKDRTVGRVLRKVWLMGRNCDAVERDASLGICKRIEIQDIKCHAKALASYRCGWTEEDDVVVGEHWGKCLFLQAVGNLIIGASVPALMSVPTVNWAL